MESIIDFLSQPFLWFFRSEPRQETESESSDGPSKSQRQDTERDPGSGREESGEEGKVITSGDGQTTDGHDDNKVETSIDIEKRYMEYVDDNSPAGPRYRRRQEKKDMEGDLESHRDKERMDQKKRHDERSIRDRCMVLGALYADRRTESASIGHQQTVRDVDKEKGRGFELRDRTSVVPKQVLFKNLSKHRDSNFRR
jgi:hypothetical protein